MRATNPIIATGRTRADPSICRPGGLRQGGTALCAGALTGLLLLAPAGAKPAITVFDPPGSVATYPQSIRAGVVTGYYVDNPGLYHGFVRSPTGAIDEIDVPDAVSTVATAISGKGAVTGYFWATDGGGTQCFVRSPDGGITTFMAGEPSSVCSGINQVGAIVGDWQDDNGNILGFLRSKKGQITSFDAGGDGDPYTFALGINRSGYIVGYYQTETFEVPAFVRGPDGTTSSFLVCGDDTVATAINDSEAIVGYCFDANSNTHSFLRVSILSTTEFDPPGALESEAAGIDRKDRIAGYYVDDNNMRHGYERLSDGTFATFDPSGSVGTTPTSIDAGAITGTYRDGSGVAHGFLRP